MTQLQDITNSPLPMLAPRSPDSHKGNYGRALLIGGSGGMSGAIAMAGLATLRSGAGLATLAVPQSIQDVVASACSCYMTLGLADQDGMFARPAVAGILERDHGTTAMAFGPGLGRSEALVEFVYFVNSLISTPMVIDADALFALS